MNDNNLLVDFLVKGGPGSGPHPGGSGKKTYTVHQTVHSYNFNTNHDDDLKAGTKVTHVDTSDKGEIFRHEGTGHEHHVDFREAKHIS